MSDKKLKPPSSPIQWMKAMMDFMNLTMEHFQNMCLNDPVMQALYRNELSWADASEDTTPLNLDGCHAPPKNAWLTPLTLTGAKRTMSPPQSPPKKKERIQTSSSPKKIPVISDEDKHKRSLFIRDIPKEVSNEDILKQIEPIAPIYRLHRSVERCFAILRFRTPEEAQRVYLKKMNQLILKGKVRKISFTTYE